MFETIRDERSDSSIESALALSLLMLRVRAYHTHDAFTMYDLAVIANLLNRCSDFHLTPAFPTYDADRVAHMLTTKLAPLVNIGSFGKTEILTQVLCGCQARMNLKLQATPTIRSTIDSSGVLSLVF